MAGGPMDDGVAGNAMVAILSIYNFSYTIQHILLLSTSLNVTTITFTKFNDSGLCESKRLYYYDRPVLECDCVVIKR